MVAGAVGRRIHLHIIGYVFMRYISENVWIVNFCLAQLNAQTVMLVE